jgi:DNA sulfur modification protein DndB
MAGIIGVLCSNKRDLKRAASKRKKEYIEESIQNEQVETYERKGWEIVRRTKTKTRIRKKKSLDELFENRLWMIFYNLGFLPMNRDRDVKLQVEPYSKKIDILAKDEDNIFVVECKSSTSEEPINARSALEEYAGKRDDIQKAIEAEWGRDCGRINVVVAISSKEKREPDEEYIRAKKDKNLLLWSEKEIKYIENLIQQVGFSAKYQLYSVIFADRKQKELRIILPAIKGKIGPHTFYTFLISAKQLLKYAYIHHRHLKGIVEASQVYQRMLRNVKLKEIAKFIDDGGYFPNSIIVNFTKQLKWDKKETHEDITMGIITLPQYFGSAWIIDGQHRLYGAARANTDVLVPVLAFENLIELEQANLFVEINVKQTSIDQKLLWDLYSDIYRDSSDEKQKKKYQIAETAKKMEAYGPLKGYIDIPSIPVDREIKLSLTTVCDTIDKYLPWELIKHPTEESKTPENVAQLINSYFEVLKSLWFEDWTKGNNGVLLTNNGFSVFMMVFHDILRHIAYKQKNILQENKAKSFEELLRKKYLTPLIEYLKIDEKTQRQIKTQTGRGSQSNNAAILDLKIHDFVDDYSPLRIEEVPKIIPPKEPIAISTIEEKTRIAEAHLRKFILEKLKTNYGSEKWWKQGLSGTIKRDCDEKWMAEVIRKPFLKKEKDTNERKFDFLDLGNLIDIVLYGDNWNQIFDLVFMNKENFHRRIKDIAVLRNPIAHTRTIEDQDVIDGIGGLLWLSQCISDINLNPYA